MVACDTRPGTDDIPIIAFNYLFRILKPRPGSRRTIGRRRHVLDAYELPLHLPRRTPDKMNGAGYRALLRIKEHCMALKWTDDLSVGVHEIDTQHKELFRRTNDLLAAMSQGKGREEVTTVLEFLGDYVVTHFGTEERYMSRYGYPDRRNHASLHSSFIAEFNSLEAKIAAGGPSSSLAIDLQKRLSSWLTNHIGSVDKVLGAYLNTKMNQAA